MSELTTMTAKVKKRINWKQRAVSAEERMEAAFRDVASLSAKLEAAERREKEALDLAERHMNEKHALKRRMDELKEQTKVLMESTKNIIRLAGQTLWVISEDKGVPKEVAEFARKAREGMTRGMQ